MMIVEDFENYQKYLKVDFRNKNGLRNKMADGSEKIFEGKCLDIL